MLTDDLYAHAEARGGQTAIVYGEERLTYAELLGTRRPLGARAGRRRHRRGRSGRAAAPNSPAFVVSFLAVAGLGAIAVPLNPQFKRGRARLLLPQQRRPGGDRRRSRDRGVGADRGGVGRRACSSSRPDRRAAARARSTGSSRRTPADGSPPARPPRTSSSSTPPGRRAGRSAWRGHTGQCWAEADSYMVAMEITPARPAVLRRSRCSTPTGWGTA